MKKLNIIWLRNTKSIIVICGFGILLLVFFTNNIDDKLIVPFAIGASTLFLGLLQYSIHHDKLFKDLFENYNHIYQQTYSEFWGRINNSNPSSILSEDDTTVVISYLNMCAEEFLWFTKGRISVRVWKSWKAGILDNLNNPLLRKLLLKEMKLDKSYYGLFSHLNVKIAIE